ncbi:MAG: DUF3467 domain-containing protein [Anaerolineales bacterium]|nr:DUF3467 domain-containing protein [Anaerolineales bacterium]
MAKKPDTEECSYRSISVVAPNYPVCTNHMLIQHTEHEFVVTFYEVLPPAVSPDPQRQARELAHIKSVPARPVARIVMSPGRAKEFVAAFQNNIDVYERHRNQSGERQEESL